MRVSQCPNPLKGGTLDRTLAQDTTTRPTKGHIMTKPRRVISLTPPSSPPPPPGTCWFCQGRFPFPAVGANGRRVTTKRYCSASCRIAAATRRQHARRSGQQIEPGTYTGPAQFIQHRPVSGPPASAVTADMAPPARR